MLGLRLHLLRRIRLRLRSLYRRIARRGRRSWRPHGAAACSKYIRELFSCLGAEDSKDLLALLARSDKRRGQYFVTSTVRNVARFISLSLLLVMRTNM
jgi:hypothetical protein